MEPVLAVWGASFQEPLEPLEPLELKVDVPCRLVGPVAGAVVAFDCAGAAVCGVAVRL